MSEQKKIGLVVTGLLSATIIAFIIGAYLSNLPEYYHLSKNAVETQGTVISKERENHMYISFEYEVGNSKFKSGGRAGDIDKDFESVRLKEKVPVYYNPLVPEDAALGNPSKRLNSSLLETCFITIIPFLLFAVYAVKSLIKDEVK